jgi:hypothetical protein
MTDPDFDFDCHDSDQQFDFDAEFEFDFDSPPSEEEILARDRRIKADGRKYREDDELIKNATDFDDRCQNAKGRQIYVDDEGYLHKEDGPAIDGKYNDYWYNHGYIHRDDGPAIITNIDSYSPHYYYAYEGKLLAKGFGDSGWVALWRIVSEEKRVELVKYLHHLDPWEVRTHNLKEIWEELTDNEKCHRLLLDLFTSNLSELA